jgi:hypothetical protein
MYRVINKLVPNNQYQLIITKNLLYTNMLSNIKKINMYNSNIKQKIKTQFSNVTQEFSDIDILD